MEDNFAKNIRYLRKKKGLSQEALADMVHADRTTITKWETAANSPDRSSLIELLKFFNVDFGEMMELNIEEMEKSAKPQIDAAIEKRELVKTSNKIIQDKYREIYLALFEDYELQYDKEVCSLCILGYIENGGFDIQVISQLIESYQRVLAKNIVNDDYSELEECQVVLNELESFYDYSEEELLLDIKNVLFIHKEYL